MDKFKHTLLIADRISSKLLTDIFKDSYNILTADSGENALGIMKEQADIDMVILDMSAPEINGYGVLEIMKKDERLKFIPVTAITSSHDPEAETRAVKLGAADFISRPFNIKTAETRVNNVICRKELEKIRTENQRLINENAAEEVQDQMFQLLLEETGTIIFNYNNENDELCYYQPSNTEKRKTESVNNYSDNYKDFYILEPEDRVKFAGEIKKLSQKPSSS